jgi:hypothetical protein
MTTDRGVIHLGDLREVLRTLESKSVQSCVCSPPYYLQRDNGIDGQIGLGTIDTYVADLVDVFGHVRRVLRDDGTLFVNLGDKYVKKQLLLVPYRVALALQDAGWVRSDGIWEKTNCYPQSAKDRPTHAHEYVFILAKQRRYFFDAEAIMEDAAWEFYGRQTSAPASTRRARPGTRPTRTDVLVWPRQGSDTRGASCRSRPRTATGAGTRRSCRWSWRRSASRQARAPATRSSIRSWAPGARESQLSPSGASSLASTSTRRRSGSPEIGSGVEKLLVVRDVTVVDHVERPASDRQVAISMLSM